ERGPVDTSFVSRHGDGLGTSADTRAFALLAGAARAFVLQAAAREASPWALADGFRLGDAEAIEVALARGEEAVSVLVSVMPRSTVRVAFADGRERGGVSAAELVLVDAIELAPGGTAPLLEMRPRLGGGSARALVSGDRIDIWCGGRHAELRLREDESARHAAGELAGSLTASLPGVVVSVQATPGRRVAAGDALVVVEAMKMEHTIRAPRAGVIEAVHVSQGERVREGDTLVTMALPESVAGGAPRGTSVRA
ncbi:MAG: acetyl-CoA carboxylase biotin carboxyl carrier protein subunit, partial [Steroidobacteraceae bacterium]